jgi:hypothetical protein
MDDQKTAPSAGSGVVSLRERAEAGWREAFEVRYPPCLTLVHEQVHAGFCIAPGDDGVWRLRGPCGNGILFSRWLVPA